MIFEKVIVQLAMICGTLMALITKGGLDYFAKGDFVRGTFFLAVAVLAIVGWLGPFIVKYRSWGVKAGRALAILLALLSAYSFIHDHFVPSLPAI